MFCTVFSVLCCVKFSPFYLSGAVNLVDVSGQLKGLKRISGLNTWKVSGLQHGGDNYSNYRGIVFGLI